MLILQKVLCWPQEVAVDNSVLRIRHLTSGLCCMHNSARDNQSYCDQPILLYILRSCLTRYATRLFETTAGCCHGMNQQTVSESQYDVSVPSQTFMVADILFCVSSDDHQLARGSSKGRLGLLREGQLE